MTPRREKLHTDGLCVTCGRKVEPHRAGRTRCQRCNDRIVEGNRQRRYERQAQGLCVDCGREPATDGYITCAGCREKHMIACKKVRMKGGYG